MSSKNKPTLKSSKINPALSAIQLNNTRGKGGVKVGITIGDPSGIGPAVTLKAISRLKGLADFVVIGDEWVFSKLRSLESGFRNIKRIDLNNIDRKHFEFGKVKAEYGRASIEYLDKALALLEEDEIDCLVTAPISKEAVALSGLKNFSGHTGYLALKTGTKHHAMLLLNKYLKISLLTEHIRLKKVSAELSREKLRQNIFLVEEALKGLFCIPKPRLVICAVNPHASDNGLLGDEENRIIKPALRSLKTKIPNLEGPLSADVALKKLKGGLYDAAIAMYHDQALIALKVLGDETGVNMTLGLPFVRTSPLHGTAFDLARTPLLAKPCSMMEAIKLAIKCTSNLKKA